MEVNVHQSGVYKMPVEHSRYNPQIVDNSYAGRMKQYQQRTASHDKPITEENHKNFMARYASKQTDYNVRVHPQPQHNTERKDIYHSRFDKHEGLNQHESNHNQAQYQSQPQNFEGLQRGPQSESQLAYEQFMAQKETRVEYRSKFAQKTGMQNEAQPVNPMDSARDSYNLHQF